MVKTLIVTGGDIKSKLLKRIITRNYYDNIIAVDKGLEALDEVNVKPDYIIGDFDSVKKDILLKYENVKKDRYSAEKDFSDTHLALKLAIELKSGEIDIIGGIGTRIDHTLANVHIMKEALKNKIQCKILNDNNEISLIDTEQEIQIGKYKYVSLLPLTEKVIGVTLEGFKYKLENATLEIGESIGISNEIIEKTAKITIKKGILIIIKSID